MKPYEVDALVARLVMGFGDRVIVENGYARIKDVYSRIVPNYSYNISNAFNVVDAVCKKGFSFMLFSDWCGSGEYVAKFVEHGGLCYWDQHNEASMAICLAALKTVKN